MPAGSAGEEFLNLLFPRRCPVCHGIAPRGRRICPECAPKLPYIETKRCRICSKPVMEDQVLCGDCQRRKHVYTQGIGIFRYNETMRSAMSYFKYKGRREYGEILGELAAVSAAERIARWRPDAVIPIPIHRRRLADRGYNQAEVLSGIVSEKTGLPHAPDLLIRTEKTRAMKELGAKERFLNLRGAFSVKAGKNVPERVLLVDDIYTTGATIDTAAEVLIRSGAAHVFFLSVCIGSGFMVEY